MNATLAQSLNPTLYQSSLPNRLVIALFYISQLDGWEISDILGHLTPVTAQAYVSQLKKEGLVRTEIAPQGTIKVWLTERGREVKFIIK